MIEGILEGEMLIRTLQITTFQKVCKITLSSKVIIQSILDPDDDFKINS